MKYLLDTDILSNLLKRRPSTALIARLATVPADEQATSSVNLGELVYGAHHQPDRCQALLGSIQRLLVPNLRVLPYDEAAAWHYGPIRAELERRGTPIGEADLKIGAIGRSQGLIVVTGNLRHFQRIPDLQVECWLVD